MLMKIKVKADILIVCPDFKPDEGKEYESFQTDGNAQMLVLLTEQHLNKIGYADLGNGQTVGIRVHIKDPILDD